MPTYRTLIQIAEVFGVTTDYILKGNDLRPFAIGDMPEEQLNALRIVISAMQRHDTGQ